MKEFVQKVRILTESLPYIKEFTGKTVVVKLANMMPMKNNGNKLIIE